MSLKVDKLLFQFFMPIEHDSRFSTCVKFSTANNCTNFQKRHMTMHKGPNFSEKSVFSQNGMNFLKLLAGCLFDWLKSKKLSFKEIFQVSWEEIFSGCTVMRGFSSDKEHQQSIFHSKGNIPVLEKHWTSF